MELKTTNKVRPLIIATFAAVAVALLLAPGLPRAGRSVPPELLAREDFPEESILKGYPGMGEGPKTGAGRATLRASIDIPVLMYHDFTRAETGSQFKMPAALFEKQMAYLADNGYTTVTPSQLAAAARGEAELPARPVMLTFDDWYPSQHELALPVLDKLGQKGVFFVIAKKVRSEAEKRKLAEMAGNGHVIGSHTVNHYYLTKTHCKRASNGCCRPTAPCGEGDIRRELAESKKELEEILGTPVTAFAWPGNYYNERAVELALAAGYETVFAVERQVREDGVLVGTVGVTRDLGTIHRVEIGGRCGMDLFPLSLVDHRCCLVSDREFHRHCRPRENELLKEGGP